MLDLKSQTQDRFLLSYRNWETVFIQIKQIPYKQVVEVSAMSRCLLSPSAAFAALAAKVGPGGAVKPSVVRWLTKRKVKNTWEFILE